ncbi:vWA domain-containing protein [Psychroserpens damuponensis]|uniref:vWA domain-containing protein n=1 Tax=Psychroserpens damuponensis TaxID=943936 RepID=UPI0005909D3C|nr:vWA domain-containing protein [Psychroserpens damuponensis]
MIKKISLLFVITLLFNCKNEPNKNAAKILANASEISNSKTIEPTKNTEIVFCLDATGSMSGLIGTAKEKIWDIVTELAQSNDVDTLKMGMVFYRDRSDTFITKQIAITTDLDEVYADLLEMTADGGGDTPESVNQALHESITNMTWSTDNHTYRTIFVVGDCPPHMDYQDDVKYTESCKLAAEKGIIINTIKLGKSCEEAIPHFRAMSQCTNGEFLMLDQDAKDYVIATPFDQEINELSKEIDNTRMYYGTHNEREYNYEKKDKSMQAYTDGSPTANSKRAEYKNSKVGKKGSYGTNEIINDYNDGKLKLDAIADNKLPQELRGLSTAEKESIIKDLSNKRKMNASQLQELFKKKNAYIKSKESKQADSTSFSKEVVKILKEQSHEKGDE